MRLLNILSLLLIFQVGVNAQNLTVSSPDEQITVSVTLADQISFSISLNNKVVVEKAVIDMSIDRSRTLGKNLTLRKKKSETLKGEIIPQVPYKDSRIPYEYNRLALSFKGNYQLIIRAYDDGIAYRFIDNDKKSKIVVDEKLSLTFPENTYSYFPEEESMYTHNERLYLHKSLEEIESGKFCSLPVMFNTNNAKVLFTEASLHDYPGMFLKKDNGNTLGSKFPKYVVKAIPNEERSPDRNQIIAEEADYIAKVHGARSYPWRVFMISDDDRQFIESNLVTKLSGTSKIDDTSWIKPGKVAWDWYNANNIFGVDFKAGINTETYKYYIDFAAKNNIEYVILDEGWTRSTTEIIADNDQIDVIKLIEYAKTKNVGIVLWVLWKPLSENTEEILKLYSSWGAKGIKVDFMQRNDQYMVSSYEEIARIAAKYKLLVNFHGAFKPAGIERVWPNILNYEGVKGGENNKWSADITPEHNVTIPFIRMAAGPMDYTPGSMVNTNEKNFKIRFERPMSMGTRCHQLAMYIVYEAPMQMLCESPSIYYREQESVDFISKVPAVWDETIVLEAAVSDYILVARRSGNDWYVGGMTDWGERDLELNLSFLPENNKYKMTMFRDGVNANRIAIDYKKTEEVVDRSYNKTVHLAKGGGIAIMLEYINQ
ncbi:MAG: glycoside hydrolase family 97 protein [Bacteroidota bacterium]